MALVALALALLAGADQRPGAVGAGQPANDDDDALRDVAAVVCAKEGLNPTPAPPTPPPSPALPMGDRDILARMRARTEKLQAQQENILFMQLLKLYTVVVLEVVNT